MLKTLLEDVRAVRERDPAARGWLEVTLCYPGLHAVWSHRFAHALWRRGFRFPARWLSQFSRFWTGIEIHPGAVIGPRLFIDHGMGVVIGETAEVGADVTLYHGVTLGGTSLEKGKRHPTLGDRVVVGAGAKILGGFHVGADSRIGANAVVVKPVPPNAVVVGVPGQILVRSTHREAQAKPDLNHSLMPDAIGDTLVSLMKRMELLEAGHTSQAPHPQVPDNGVWHAEDFSI
jgi:serine O-acetyltransferase